MGLGERGVGWNGIDTRDLEPNWIEIWEGIEGKVEREKHCSNNGILLEEGIMG